MPLTDTAIRQTKPGAARLKLSDGGGLHVEVSPKGAKTWKLSYRHRGKQKTITGGRYPEPMSLALARGWREECKARLRAGDDPAVAVKQARVIAKSRGESFEEVGKEWLAKQEGVLTPRYKKWVERRLELDVYPSLGAKSVGDVEHRDILDLIQLFEDRDVLEQGRKVLRYVGKIMRFAMHTNRADKDPMPNVREVMKPKRRVKHFAALPAKRLPEFFGRLASHEADVVTKLALKWTLLTMVRTQETRFARPEEIEDIDGPEPLWRLSPERMKMSREHLVPLSRQAVALYKQIAALAAKQGSPWMFSQTINPKKPISENRMLYCLYDLDYKGVATVHGFRGLASTVLNEQVSPDDKRRFDADWVEMQLAHVEDNDSRAAYNAAEYIVPRRRMIQWWANYLDDQERMGALL